MWSWVTAARAIMLALGACVIALVTALVVRRQQEPRPESPCAPSYAAIRSGGNYRVDHECEPGTVTAPPVIVWDSDQDPVVIVRCDCPVDNLPDAGATVEQTTFGTLVSQPSDVASFVPADAGAP